MSARNGNLPSDTREIMNRQKIAIILPHRERFSSAVCGAVGLCAREYVLHSRFGEGVAVYGGCSEVGFAGVRYRKVGFDKAWYRSGTRAYCDALVEVLGRERAAVVEINNRPVMVQRMQGRVAGAMVLYLHGEDAAVAALVAGSLRGGFMQQRVCERSFFGWLGERRREGACGVSGDRTAAGGFARERKGVFVLRQNGRREGALPFAQALARVLPLLSDWSGVMVGARRQDSEGLSGYERKIVETLKPLGERVAYLGFRSYAEAMERFQKAHIAVIPSLVNEGFGRAAVEALASGCALVCSYRGGLKEITRGGGGRRWRSGM